ncbi:MFS transporter [Arthrobacter sp. SW1]|uniref:MFS transporter n=1 Tax=Arthrobacter sp. SW1 TaxID=1920889 RepID=UPI000877B400|nr:MFS transporter [Arthrobacter sp. SW1]OFI38122.1 MFS transporter [Arthrobacter sp. SW1]
MTSAAPASELAPRTRRTAPDPRLLLASQLIFNIGFFSVVPFLATVMRDDFGMGALAVGVVLGARTFAQQGMFLFGGALADRWGARRSMVTGTLVRVTGYLLLAWATDFPTFLAGAIVTGIGGALFSPALESLLATAEAARKAGAGHKTSLFTLLVICGETGAVTGPLLGSLLLGIGFDAALLAGAAVFAVMAAVFHRFLPAHRPATTKAGPADGTNRPARATPSGAWSCLRERRFVLFAAFYSVNLLAYNQLYFGLTVELERSGADTGALGLLFSCASVMTIALQWPVSKLVRRMGRTPAFAIGFGLQGAGFAALAAFATQPPGAAPIVPALVMVAALCLGHMFVTPLAMGLVIDFAAGRPSGAYYGLLASSGGVMVLLGNAVLGPLYEFARTPSPAAAAPWLLMAAFTAVSAVFLPRCLPLPRS